MYFGKQCPDKFKTISYRTTGLCSFWHCFHWVDIFLSCLLKLFSPHLVLVTFQNNQDDISGENVHNIQQNREDVQVRIRKKPIFLLFYLIILLLVIMGYKGKRKTNKREALF